MSTSDPLRPVLPITPEDWDSLVSLAERLTAEQLLWASGYLAGFGKGTERTASASSGAIESASTFAEHAGAEVTVLYASETGNAAHVATTLADQLNAEGFVANAHDMASYKPRALKDIRHLIVITSTHGEGDPPEPALSFFEALDTPRAPKLDGVQFAILGLGDSTYEHYCGAALRLDARLEALGAERLLERRDCDVDYDDDAADWSRAIIERLGGLAAPASTRGVSTRTPSQVFDKHTPYSATVLENLQITGRGSTKETRHLELDLAGSGLTYQPGDALGVSASNDPLLVEKILAAFDLTGSESVTTKSGEMTMQEALAQRLEITALTPRFLEAWAGWSRSSELAELSTEDQREERAAYMKSHHILDVVTAFPARGLDPGEIVSALRQLQPRLYSIASSMAAVGEEAHVTVRTVRYDLHGLPRLGVASGAFSERIQAGEQLPVYIHHNDNFRLPSDSSRPIVMIGAGTGVAPFRAFMQDMEESGIERRAWLFFGERQFRTDFLYQADWLAWRKSGLLDRIDVAFSRDAADKIYVQDRIRDRARDLFGWMENGAHFYVCGDAERLAPAVHQSLISVIASASERSRDEAEDYLRNLQKSGRYQRDVY